MPPTVEGPPCPPPLASSRRDPAGRPAPGPRTGAAPDVPVGAHIQVGGGLARGGLRYTDAVGARAVQVFVGNPRGWRLTDGDPAQDAAFVAGCAERDVPAFVHTPFLVNVVFSA